MMVADNNSKTNDNGHQDQDQDLWMRLDVKPSCSVIDEVEGVVAPGEQVGEDRPEEDRLVADDVQQPG